MYLFIYRFHAAVLKFLSCRSANESTRYLLECELPDQVIHVKKALLAFSKDWNAADDPPRCRHNVTCEMFTEHSEISACNGKHNCTL